MGTASRRRARSGPGIALGALAFLLWSGGRAGVLDAQVSVDLSGLAVRYDGVPTMRGAQVAPVLRHAGERLYLEFGGSGARFDDGTWSADGGGLVAWRPGMRAGVTPELIGQVGFAGAKGSPGTTDAGVTARMHRGVGALDLFVGGGLDRTDGVLGPRTLGNGEIGATLAAGEGQLSASLVPVWGRSTRYADLALYARREGRVTVEVTGGFRQITVPERSGHGWIGGSAELGLGSRVALVATGGSFPLDPGEGFPGGRFASLGLRLGRNTRSTLRPPQTAPVSRPLPWPGATFEVRDRGAGEHEIVVTASAAQSVEIAGDFTDWAPVALVRDGAKWRVWLPIARGVHRFGLRIDGGAWQVPPGVGRTTDEFGGEAGILAID